MNLKLNIFGHRIVLQGRCTKIRNELAYGYTNRCKDGKYIVTLDYDGLELEWIKDELKQLQYQFWLGDFYIFKSSERSYHAVCFDKLILSDYIEVLRNAAIDLNYINVPLHWGKKVWTLRLSDKEKVPVKYICKVNSKVSDHHHSSAHADFISNIFKIKIDLERPDNQKKLILAKYYI